MTFIKLLIAAFFCFLAITFAYQNDFNVIIKYWGITEGIEVPFFVTIVVSFFSGLIIGGIGGLINDLLLKREIARLRKEIQSSEGEKRIQ